MYKCMLVGMCAYHMCAWVNPRASVQTETHAHTSMSVEVRRQLLGINSFLSAHWVMWGIRLRSLLGSKHPYLLSHLTGLAPMT